METSLKDKILFYIERLPALSPTISKIIELTQNSNTSASDLLKVIKLDPVLTAKILRLINSAYFGMPESVTSINTAIVLLGFNTIKNLALSTEVLSSFNPGKGVEFNVEKFWLHSLAAAVTCKTLALHILHDHKVQEEYFISGLIHDIGKIFLIKFFPSQFFSINFEKMGIGEFLKKEKELFSIDHAEAGGLIVEKWKLSREMISSVKNHHTMPENAGKRAMRSIVYFSNIYCKSIGFDDMIGAITSNDLTSDTWKSVGLTEKEGESVFSELPAKIEESKIFLKIK
ncbi:MAG: HDOD domain-containing protein [Nitrospinae bacterium]|nr:HDOD domain-containing protein [Nitrospinota bacterium]